MIGKDLTDENIIKLLSKDTRQSSRKLAKQLNISASTVRSRLRRLIRNNYLHFIIAVDPFKAGFPVIAQILLDVRQDKIEQTLESLVTFPEISYVSSTTGRFDIIIFGCFVSHQDLATFLQNKLGKMEGVRDSETLICLDIKKGQFVPVQ
jgi:Lrp/AsnC family transcriptional regulator, regulator for asnA, asnC and gidA